MGIAAVLGSWGRLLSYGGIAIVLLIEFAGVRRTEVSQANEVAIVATVVTVVVAWTLLVERYRQDRTSVTSAALIIILGAGAATLNLLSSQGGSLIAAIVALSMASNRFDARIGNVYAVVLIVAYLLTTVVRSGMQPVLLLSYGLGLGFAFLASRSVAYLRAEQSRTQRLLEELRDSRDAQVEAAEINERARIAREIHDVLAHTLAALAVQLEGARLRLEQRGDDAEVLGAVERAHRLAKEGIDETRSAVSALRGDRVPGTEQLALLIDEFEQVSGTTAELRIEGAARVLAPEAQLAIYRTAQEALTNIRKHALAEHVEAVLRYDPQGTELTVTDVGNGSHASSDGGYGLTGMRERAELLGGRIEAGRTDGGFRVRLWLPG